MDLNGYKLHVTEQEFPHLETPWTQIDLTGTNKTFRFQRDANKSQVFTISGYISESTWVATRQEALGLNNSLNNQPSGTFTDGYGTSWQVIVEDWVIEPIAAMNKYDFRMTLRTMGK